MSSKLQIFTCFRILILLSFFNAYGQNNKQPNVYFPFYNGTANNFGTAGSSFNGTATGIVLAEGRCGEPNAAFSFTGSNTSKVVVADVAGSPLDIADQFSFSAWIYIPDAVTLTGRNMMILSKVNATSTTGYSFGITNGYPFVILHNGASFLTTVSSKLITKNTWHHVGSTFLSGNFNGVRLYVDNELFQTGVSHTFSATANDESLTIGGSRFDNTAFEGAMQEVRIYNQRLNNNDNDLAGFRDIFTESQLFNLGTLTGLNACENINTNVTASIAPSSILGAAYQWYREGILLTDDITHINTSTNTLTIQNTPPLFDGSVYGWVVSTTSCVKSVAGVLTVQSAPNVVNTFSGLLTCPGAVFSVNAVTNAGTNLAFRWLFNGTPLSGGGVFGNSITTTSLNFNSPTASNNGNYRLSFTGACLSGAATTSGFSLTVAGITTITAIASPTHYCPQGADVSFFSTVNGLNVAFAWGVNGGAAIPGGEVSVLGIGTAKDANTSTLTWGDLEENLTTRFVLTASGFCGTDIKTSLGLNMLPKTQIAIAPPLTVNSCVDQTTSIPVSIIGDNLQYRWLFATTSTGALGPANNSTNFGPGNTIAGVTTHTLQLRTNNNAIIAGSINNYFYVLSASGTCGVVTTTGTQFKLLSSGEITQNPVSVSICGFTGTVFSVAGTGALPFSYAWYKSSSPTLSPSTLINASTDGGIYGTSFSTTGLNISAAPMNLSNTFYFSVFNSGCGSVTSAGANLFLYSLPGITLQPPTTITTCAGLNVISRVVATGSGLNFQWQVNTGSGVFFNIVSSATGSSLSYANFTNSILGINSIPLFANGYEYRALVSSQFGCGTVQTSTSANLVVNQNPETAFFGLSSTYCDNSTFTDLTAFSNLPNYPFGSFSVSPSVTGLLTVVSGMTLDRIRFNPAVITADGTTFTVSFTTVPDANNCRGTYTRNATVYTTSGFNLEFINPAFNLNVANNDAPVNLTVNSSVPGIGRFFTSSTVTPDVGGTVSVTNQGIVGNTFFPTLFTPKPVLPTTAYHDFTLFYEHTHTLTGCVSTISSDVRLYDPTAFFLFSAPGMAAHEDIREFCANDMSTYSISFTGPNPATLSIFTCPRGFSITSPLLNSLSLFTNTYFDSEIGTTRNNMFGYQFVPSQVPLASLGRNILLSYNYDEAKSGFPCNTVRSGARVLRSQNIIVHPTPPTPIKVTNREYCFGKVSQSGSARFLLVSAISGQSARWYTTTSTGSLVPALNGLTSVDVNSLGINDATPVGIYTFYVRFTSNGCLGNFTEITVTIKPNPTAPVVASFPPMCKNQYLQFNMAQKATATGANLQWLNQNKFNVTNASAWNIDANFYTDFFLGNAYIENYESNTFTTSTYTLYTFSLLNGCVSDTIPVVITFTGKPSSAYKEENIFECINTPANNAAPVTATFTGTTPGMVKWYISTPNFVNYVTNEDGFFRGDFDLIYNYELINVNNSNVWYYYSFAGESFTTVSGYNSISTFTPPIVIATVGAVNRLRAYFEDAATGCITPIMSSNKFIINSNNYPQPPLFISTSSGLTLCNNEPYPLLRMFSFENADRFNVYRNSDKTHLLATNTNVFPSAFTGYQEAINDYGSFVHPTVKGQNFIDTTFYYTQVANGCESLTTAGHNFKMHGPFQAFSINNPAVQGSVLLPELSNSFCSQRFYSTVSITGLSELMVAGIRVEDAELGLLSQNSSFSFPHYTDAGTKTWYIEQRKQRGSGQFCVSPLTTTSVSFDVKLTPLPPTARDTAFCETDNSLNFAVAASTTFDGVNVPTFRWYTDVMDTFGNYVFSMLGTGSIATAPGGNIKNTYQNPFLFNPITFSGGSSWVANYYYVTQEVNGCESNQFGSYTYLYVFRQPDEPVPIQPQPYCSGQTIAGLALATQQLGSTYEWYNSEVATVPAFVGTVYESNTPNTISGFDIQNPFINYLYYVGARRNVFNTPRLSFNGCLSTLAVVTVTVNSIPTPPTIPGIFSYCSRQSIEDLNAIEYPGAFTTWYSNTTATGGVITNNFPTGLSGRGVLNTESYDFFVTQTLNGCQSPFAKTILTIRPLPILSITGLAAAYCQYNAPVTLNGVSVSGSSFIPLASGTFVGLGLSNANMFTPQPNGTAIFNPTQSTTINQQNISIRYIYADGFGCVDSVTRPTIVSRKTLMVLDPIDTLYCSYQGLRVPLTGNIPNAQFFNGKGENLNREFIPANADFGANTITYRFIDENNCLTDTTTTVMVYPVPNTQFSLSSLCVGDSILIKDLSTLPVTTVVSELSQWRWRVGGTSYTTKNVNVVFARPGLVDVELTATTTKGCQTTHKSTMDIGSYPVVKFDWRNICEGSSTVFNNQSSIFQGESIERWKWDFGVTTANNDTSNMASTQFQYPAAGKYVVKLTVVSNAPKFCTTTDSAHINILPSIKLHPSMPYTQNFSATDGNWFAAGRNSSWQYQQGDFNGWKTGGNGNYNRNESSALYSPCFDISALNKPMVSFDIGYATERTDGVVLQFSTDNGNIWRPVQTQNTGINWFNARELLSDPGEQLRFQDSLIAKGLPTGIAQVGWSGTVAGFRNARNILDDALKTYNLQLRFAFASAGESVADGVKITNFSLQERSRVSLIENFVNIRDTASSTAARVIDTLFNRFREDVVAVQYHTSSPQGDPFNTVNPADPSSRLFYYGVDRVPRAALNGTIQPGRSDNLSFVEIYRQSLEPTNFDIRIETDNIMNSFGFKVDFTANTNLPDREYNALVAIVEREVFNIQGANGKSKYEYVLRKMMPSAAGNTLRGGWNAGEARNISGAWNYQPNAVINPNQLGVVAFIQDKETKRVLQANYIGPKQAASANSIEVFVPQTNAIMIYPNPATEEVMVLLSRTERSNTEVELYNQIGVKVLTASITAGQLDKKINLSYLPNGVYYVRVGGEMSKLVIAR